MNLEQIQARLAEIAGVASDKEKRSKLSIEEMDAMIQEKEQLEERKIELEAAEQARILANKDEVAKRHKLLDDIAKGNKLLPIIQKGKGDEMDEVIVLNAESAEYRSAWLKNIRKLELNDVEKRALTTVEASVGAVIPTLTMNKIIEKIEQSAPLLSKIDLVKIPGGTTYAVEGVINDADLHAEGVELNDDADTLVPVTLGAYEVTKLIKISKSVSKMSIEAFDAWIIKKLSSKLARKITECILYGSGTDQPQGIDNAVAWGATNSVTVALAGTLSATNVRDLIGLLPGGYDAGAEWLMSKKTFMSDFSPLQDNAKHNLITQDGRQFFVGGYPVMFDDRITLHEAYLGDLMGYAGNMPEEANIVSQFIARNNAFDILGSAMFDGKLALTEAFVKLIKATS